MAEIHAEHLQKTNMTFAPNPYMKMGPGEPRIIYFHRKSGKGE
jgi:hypothetical protein